MGEILHKKWILRPGHSSPNPERQAGHTCFFITSARITAREAGTNFSIRFIMQQGAGTLQACPLSPCRTTVPSGRPLRGGVWLTHRNFQTPEIWESSENTGLALQGASPVLSESFPGAPKSSL